MGVKFLHAADLHLGSPLQAVTGASETFADYLKKASYESFENLITIAIENNVDFVVLAGDLYDREARSIEANQFLVDQFERLDNEAIPCYVVHGNHDPIGDGAEKLEFPSNVEVFGTEDVETVHYPTDENPQARILGRSYGRRHESDKFYYHYSPKDQTVPNIGLLHTGLNPDGRRYAPCGPNDLSSKDIDYWALGHIHDPRAVDGAPAAYSGIPQGRHIGEASVGGCLLVDVGARSKPDIEFVPVSPVVWQRVTVDLESAAEAEDQEIRNITDIASYIDDLALEIRNEYETTLFDDFDFESDTADWTPDGFVCRWILEGRCEVHEILGEAELETLSGKLRARLKDNSPFIWTEGVRDRTARPLPEIDELAENDEVIGELVEMADDIRDDPEIRSDLRAKTGELWETVEDRDREEIPADQLALTDDKLDDFIDRAVTLAVDELARRRYNAD